MASTIIYILRSAEDHCRVRVRAMVIYGLVYVTLSELSRNCVKLINSFLYLTMVVRGRRGSDRIEVGFTTTYVISFYHH
jgi:hypothetical protein